MLSVNGKLTRHGLSDFVYSEELGVVRVVRLCFYNSVRLYFFGVDSVCRVGQREFVRAVAFFRNGCRYTVGQVADAKRSGHASFGYGVV